MSTHKLVPIEPTPEIQAAFESPLWKSFATRWQHAVSTCGKHAELPKDVIRSVFIENGFTIKEGQSDLKQYVYDAAHELLRRASHGQAPIDMVLHCPACGMQHIDKDNHEELRIEAAELGVDREGERELERWIEEREWENPPHRSHLCLACGHIWRPADVPTNGVQAVKTVGKADSPIVTLTQKSQMEAIGEVVEQLENDGTGFYAKVRWLYNPIPDGEQLYWPQP